MIRPARSTWWKLASVALVATLLTACGDDSSSGGGAADDGGLPDKIPVTVVTEVTGFGALYGQFYQQGIETAVDEVNASGMLGSSKLEISVKDTGSDPVTATNLVSQAGNSDAVAILGPTLSNLALATAPVAQKAKVPFLADTSSADLLKVGDHVFSLSSPETTRLPLLAAEIADSVSTVSIVLANDNPLQVEVFKEISPMLEAAGVKILQTNETPIAATDLSALVTKTVDAEPDGILMLTGGAQGPALLTALTNAGYDGLLFAEKGFDGILANAGDSAEGLRYAANWAAQIDTPENKTFLGDLTAAYPDASVHWPTVDGYNGVYLLARAIAKAGSVDREKVLAALVEVAEQGFDTPSGPATFTGEGNRQMSTPGVIVEMQGGEPVLVRSDDD